MPLDFPNVPTNGQVFNAAGVSWRWDGTKWTSVLSTGGPFLPLAGGDMTGPLNYTATGGTVARSAQDRAADVANVLDFGADPTGVADSSAAFSAALALRRNGRPSDVFAPSGTFLINNPITVGDAAYSQRLFGNGWSTVLTVGPGFSSSASGVIIIQTTPYNDATAQASVCDLRIHFQQPPDFSTTATATTVSGGTTITVASVAGARVGSYVFNQTGTGSMPSQSIMAKVTNIAGNVVTIDRPTLLGIGIGHAITFAANRSQMVTLTSAPTLNPGDPGIKYPWAIYCGIAQSFFMDHVLVSGAWNGVYIRGQTFVIGQYCVGCLNIGLDVDQCFNFPKIDHFMLWGWGIPSTMQGVYYDGQTIAANIGRCDDFTCDIFQTWCGAVNFTAAWSWGQINQLKLDGDNSRLTVAGVAGTRLQIGELYKTAGQNHVGVPMELSGACAVSVDNVFITAGQNNPTITLAGGSLTVNGGYMWNGVLGANPMISVTGGDLSIDQTRFDSSTTRAVSYLVQTGGSVRVSNASFLVPPSPGTAGFVLVDNARNAIVSVDLNGWGCTIPGVLGWYQVRQSGVTTISSGWSVSGTLNATGAATFGSTVITQGFIAADALNFIQAGGGSNNTIRLTPAAPGGSPNLAVLGGDANASMTFTAPGTGAFNFQSSVLCNKGISFGGQLAASINDLSKGIDLYGGIVGLNLTSSRFNHVAPSGNAHMFVVNSVDRLAITGTGLGFNGTAAIAKPTGYGAPTGAATRATFATGSVTLPVLAEHVKALIDDLTSYGLIGP